MPKAVKRKRSYDSPRRREQATATRRAVLDAARALFLDRGYGATTIDGIAARAEVSPETIYATFRNKRALLSQLLDESIVGDDAPVPVLERVWVQQMRDEPDVRRRVKILARNARLILERRAPIDEVLRGAAATDRRIADFWDASRRQRFEGQSALLRIALGSKGMRRGASIEAAADTYFAIASPEAYRALTFDRGWTADRFERWLERTIVHLFLDDA